MSPWLIALIVLVGSFVLAPIVTKVVKSFCAKPNRPDALRGLVDVIGTFTFWAIIAFGLMLAAGVTNPETLKPIPTKLINYFPKVLIAGVVLIAGMVFGSIAALATDRAVVKASGETRPALPRLVRSAVILLMSVIAVGQLGIDTRIVQLVLSGLVYSLALGAALLVGLGGREVARHVAAGRTVRSMVASGDVVEVDGVAGTVGSVRATSIELVQPSGKVVYVPHGRTLDAIVTVDRQVPAAEPTTHS